MVENLDPPPRSPTDVADILTAKRHRRDSHY
jgi:hypothetical protein